MGVSTTLHLRYTSSDAFVVNLSTMPRHFTQFTRACYLRARNSNSRTIDFVNHVTNNTGPCQTALQTGEKHKIAIHNANKFRHQTRHTTSHQSPTTQFFVPRLCPRAEERVGYLPAADAEWSECRRSLDL